MKQNYFQYNERFLQPDKGIAMGSPISCTMAELYLQYIEETYVKQWVESKEIKESPPLRNLRSTPSQLLSPQHIPTQHDMLPQHLVCKNELNCEYCNITLARYNKAP